MCISKPVLPPLEMREQGIAPTATAELLPASSKHTSNRSASCSYAINLMCVGIDYPHIVMRRPSLLFKDAAGQLWAELSDGIRQRNRLDIHPANLHGRMRKESRGWPHESSELCEFMMLEPKDNRNMQQFKQTRNHNAKAAASSRSRSTRTRCKLTMRRLQPHEQIINTTNSINTMRRLQPHEQIINTIHSINTMRRLQPHEQLTNTMNNIRLTHTTFASAPPRP